MLLNCMTDAKRYERWDNKVVDEGKNSFVRAGFMLWEKKSDNVGEKKNTMSEQIFVTMLLLCNYFL